MSGNFPSGYSSGWVLVYIDTPFPLQEFLGHGVSSGYYKCKFKHDNRLLAILIASASLPDHEEYPHITLQVKQKKASYNKTKLDDEDFFNPHLSFHNNHGNKISLNQSQLRQIGQLIQTIVMSSDEAFDDIARFLF